MPDAGIVPSTQADGEVRQLAGGTRAASLTHRCMAVGSLRRDRAVSSRQLRRLTIGPGRGQGRALRFVPTEVSGGPHGPPTAMCGG